VDPEDLWELGQEFAYEVDLRWDSAQPDGRFDVVLRRGESSEFTAAMDPLPEVKSWRELANNPARGLFAKKLVPQLRSFLEGRLPDYMIPAAFVLLEELPLTPNGKVDRNALPAPGRERSAVEAEYIAPRNELEQKLAAIWSEVLGVSKIGVNDNFYHLGGHSLMATQLLSRINKAFQLRLPLPVMFESPTVASLAAIVEQKLLDEIAGLPEYEVQRLVDAAQHSA
jgi:acyl carrier protein